MTKSLWLCMCVFVPHQQGSGSEPRIIRDSEALRQTRRLQILQLLTQLKHHWQEHTSHTNKQSFSVMTWSYVLSFNHNILNSYMLCSHWMSVFVVAVCLLHDTETMERAPKQRAHCLRSSGVIGETWQPQPQQQQRNMLQMLVLWLVLDWWSVC